MSIRIVIADDHEIFRDGFKLLLAHEGLELVGEAENGRELVTLVGERNPDVVITDIKMPLMDGIEASRQLKQQSPGVGIIALSMFNEDNLIVDMLEAGARGYLLKNTNKAEVHQAVTAVHRGSTYYCSATSSRLARMIAESRFNPYKDNPRPTFTPREIDVIRLICQEYTNKEIAAALGLSTRTVEGYRETIQDKMEVKNSVGIAIYAIKTGLYELEGREKRD